MPMPTRQGMARKPIKGEIPPRPKVKGTGGLNKGLPLEVRVIRANDWRLWRKREPARARECFVYLREKSRRAMEDGDGLFASLLQPGEE